MYDFDCVLALQHSRLHARWMAELIAYTYWPWPLSVACLVPVGLGLKRQVLSKAELQAVCAPKTLLGNAALLSYLRIRFVSPSNV
jgi:hypothetical protein